MKVFGFEIKRTPTKPTRFLGDLVRLSLSPGDVCVLLSRKPMDDDEVEHITMAWRAAVGDDVTLMVLDDGLRLGVLSPPQAAAVHERIDDAEAVERALSE